MDTSATAIDADSTDLDTGTLTIGFTTNGNGDDRLEFSNQGSGAGQIGVANGTLSFGGTAIGTYTGGAGTTELVATFNAQSTPAAVQALLRRLTFANLSDDPTSASRTLRVVLTDGDGGTSTLATVTVSITPVDDPPVISGIEGTTLAVVENDPAKIVSAQLTVSDVDSAQFQSASVSIRAGWPRAKMY